GKQAVTPTLRAAHDVVLQRQGGRLTTATGVRVDARKRSNPGSNACFLFSAERQPQTTWVGLLARKVRGEPRWPLRLPRPCGGRVAFRSDRLHSQWRNRAGLAPDFPVMPLVGTQGSRHRSTTAGGPERGFSSRVFLCREKAPSSAARDRTACSGGAC